MVARSIHHYEREFEPFASEFKRFQEITAEWCAWKRSNEHSASDEGNKSDEEEEKEGEDDMPDDTAVLQTPSTADRDSDEHVGRVDQEQDEVVLVANDHLIK